MSFMVQIVQVQLATTPIVGMTNVCLAKRFGMLMELTPLMHLIKPAALPLTFDKVRSARLGVLRETLVSHTVRRSKMLAVPTVVIL